MSHPEQQQQGLKIPAQGCPRGPREPRGAPGGPKRLQGPQGAPSGPMGPHGTPWGPLGPLMGPYGPLINVSYWLLLRAAEASIECCVRCNEHKLYRTILSLASCLHFGSRLLLGSVCSHLLLAIEQHQEIPICAFTYVAYDESAFTLNNGHAQQARRYPDFAAVKDSALFALPHEPVQSCHNKYLSVFAQGCQAPWAMPHGPHVLWALCCLYPMPKALVLGPLFLGPRNLRTVAGIRSKGAQGGPWGPVGSHGVLVR